MGFEGFVVIAVVVLVVFWITFSDKDTLNLQHLKRVAKPVADRLGGRVVPELSDSSVSVEWIDEAISRGLLVLRQEEQDCICEISCELRDVAAAWAVKVRPITQGRVLSFYDVPLELDGDVWRSLLCLGIERPRSAFELSVGELTEWSFSLREGQLQWRCRMTKGHLESESFDAMTARACELFLGFVKELGFITQEGGAEALLSSLILSGGDVRVRRWAVSASAKLEWPKERYLGLFDQLLLKPDELAFALEVLSDDLLQLLSRDERLSLFERALRQDMKVHQGRLLSSCLEVVDVAQLEVEQLKATPRACFKLMKGLLDSGDEASPVIIKARVLAAVGHLDVEGYVELLGLMAQHPQWGWEGVLGQLPADVLRSTQVIEGVLQYCESSFMKGGGVVGSSSLAQTLVWSMACARQGQLERLVPLLLNVCKELALAPLVEAQRHSDEMEAAGRVASRLALEKLVSTLQLDASKVGALSVAADSVQGALSVAGEAGSLSQVK